ncbi:squalene synthetase-like protein [Rhizina undulata]
MHKPEGASISEPLQPPHVVLSIIESPNDGDIVGAGVTPFNAENRGRKLLEKMGYISGTPLGRRSGEATDANSSHHVDPLPIPLQEQQQHQTQRQRRHQKKPQEKEQQPTDKCSNVHSPAPSTNNPRSPTIPYQHPFSIKDLRDPAFLAIPVQMGNTLVMSRRNHIALVRLGELLESHVKAHGEGPLSADAFNAILHRCISLVSSFQSTSFLRRDEGGVVMDEISDEALQPLVMVGYLRQTVEMAKAIARSKKGNAKQANSKPTNSKPANAKPANAKTADAKPGNTKKANVKKANTKKANAKTSNSKKFHDKPKKKK